MTLEEYIKSLKVGDVIHLQGLIKLLDLSDFDKLRFRRK